MKKHTQSIKGFCMGLLVSGLIAGTVLPAAALSSLRDIKVSMGGIQIFVDGKLQVPTDAKGNTVEPLIYNGTTYLPVRAAVGMLTDKPVEWDSRTESIYIGKKPGSGQVVRMDTLKVYDSSRAAAFSGTDAQFTLLGETQTPFNLMRRGSTLKLDAGYTTLRGEFVIPYSDLKSRAAGKLCIYSVDQYGVKNLLDSYELRAGDGAVSVETNVRGCDFLFIEIEHTEMGDWYGSSGMFYNVTLTTAAAN